MKHRFEEGKTKKGNPQQTFVIEIESLTSETLHALPHYVIDHVHLIFEAHNNSKTDTYWPIVVEVSGDLRISEEMMWGMVCDSVADTKRLVVKYINRLCDLAKHTKWGDLLYNDGCNFIGSFALKPFLDRYLESEECQSAHALPVYGCFFNFIRHCDLEFETWQDEYIENVLGHLYFVDDDLFIQLLCYRLGNGQCTDKDFRFFYFFIGRTTQETGRLKKIIDYLTGPDNLDIDSSFHYKEASYLQLCASIYGSYKKETDEVMEYVRQQVGDKLCPIRPHQQRYINRIRAECDAFRAFQPTSDGFLDSSFHKYDLRNKRWVALDIT